MKKIKYYILKLFLKNILKYKKYIENISSSQTYFYSKKYQTSVYLKTIVKNPPKHALDFF